MQLIYLVNIVSILYNIVYNSEYYITYINIINLSLIN